MVYNTLSKKYEEFIPLNEGEVSIYVCGVTPYDYSHIGHARPAVFWDVVRRYLSFKGYRVTLVTNFTDIDDRLINKSKQTGTPIAQIAEKYTEDYLEAMDMLGVQRADEYPRASGVVPEIINTVKVLVEKGFAYESSGDVYFRAKAFEGYGKLSGRKTEVLLPGARIEISELKKSPFDWALWKSSSQDEPGWKSPWGRGRPGWHIECSAMVYKYLGPSIDFHGGGTDLVFPHHENELAQSEAFSGVEPFSKYWLHNEMLRLEGEKMSKSIGNVVALGHILKNHHPMAVRLYLLSAHRRKILEFSEELLSTAEKGWERIRTGYLNAREFLANPTPRGLFDASRLSLASGRCRKTFFEAMDNDFATPAALASVFDLVSAINSQVVTQTDTRSGQEARQIVSEAFGLLVKCLGILGLVPESRGQMIPQSISAFDGLADILIEMRTAARKRGDYETADLIRDKMARVGVALEDTPSGTKIHLRPL